MDCPDASREGRFLQIDEKIAVSKASPLCNSLKQGTLLVGEGKAGRLHVFSVMSESSSSSSSSFVLGRFSGGTSETPADRFLYASFFHPGKPPRSPTDEDEGRRRRGRTGGGLGHGANRSLCQKVGQMSRVFQAALRVGNA